MTTATIFDLEAHNQVDLTTVLTGPLREARLVTLAPQHSETLTADDREHTLFVLEGTGTARTSITAVDLAPGTAVTVPLGGALVINAGVQPMRYFHASLSVPASHQENHQ
jgi:mannose-6-phosphate isomerase-like protein (cupin superfamily)